jgi:transcriptional regulator NrdR family protein
MRPVAPPSQPSICPKCKQQTAITIESRISKGDIRRRRKECTECSNRFTVYEVSEEFYKTALEHKSVIDKLIKSLNLNLVSDSKYESSSDTCDECVHMLSSGCSFEFPDAGGTFARECSMFERNSV